MVMISKKMSPRHWTQAIFIAILMVIWYLVFYFGWQAMEEVSPRKDLQANVGMFPGPRRPRMPPVGFLLTPRHRQDRQLGTLKTASRNKKLAELIKDEIPTDKSSEEKIQANSDFWAKFDPGNSRHRGIRSVLSTNALGDQSLELKGKESGGRRVNERGPAFSKDPSFQLQAFLESEEENNRRQLDRDEIKNEDHVRSQTGPQIASGNALNTHKAGQKDHVNSLKGLLKDGVSDIDNVYYINNSETSVTIDETAKEKAVQFDRLHFTNIFASAGHGNKRRKGKSNYFALPRKPTNRLDLVGNGRKIIQINIWNTNDIVSRINKDNNLKSLVSIKYDSTKPDDALDKHEPTVTSLHQTPVVTTNVSHHDGGTEPSKTNYVINRSNYKDNKMYSFISREGSVAVNGITNNTTTGRNEKLTNSLITTEDNSSPALYKPREDVDILSNYLKIGKENLLLKLLKVRENNHNKTRYLKLATDNKKTAINNNTRESNAHILNTRDNENITNTITTNSINTTTTTTNNNNTNANAINIIPTTNTNTTIKTTTKINVNTSLPISGHLDKLARRHTLRKRESRDEERPIPQALPREIKQALINDFISGDKFSEQRPLGGEVELSCQTEAMRLLKAQVPNVPVHWRLNGDPIVVKPSRMLFRGDDLLVIQDLMIKDSGVYECRVQFETRHTMPLAFFALTVTSDVPTVFARESEPLSLDCHSAALAKVLHMFDLTLATDPQFGCKEPCQYMGLPDNNATTRSSSHEASKTWFLNGSRTPFFQDSMDAKLDTEDVLQSSTKEMSGVWWCQTTHAGTNAKWTTAWYRVFIKDPPPYIEVWWNSVLARPWLVSLLGTLALAVCIAVSILIARWTQKQHENLELRWQRTKKRMKKSSHLEETLAAMAAADTRKKSNLSKRKSIVDYLLRRESVTDKTKPDGGKRKSIAKFFPRRQSILKGPNTSVSEATPSSSQWSADRDQKSLTEPTPPGSLCSRRLHVDIGSDSDSHSHSDAFHDLGICRTGTRTNPELFTKSYL